MTGLDDAAGLDDATLAALRERLLRSKAEHDTESARLERSVADIRDARSDGTADDEHDPDGPTLSAEWSHATGVQREQREKGEAIADALERMDAGTYGLCAVCGEPIPLARLEVRPFARTCVVHAG
ncbi:TraR/DksA family transcriptional regulator [Marisediminicola sp. LYQ134]|uniref:TraR/DksA family transcriptional regulator n=1 Tax=Marisediminicola sp. LYQ134 TaxID=3391061 RepID=UPI0039837A9D